ncbi:hypothetical protein MLD38_000761 [Melastoma candidum]|uniref:Uncharacterized protein n=1 Tax=Melastoma candidum TaxID=119954 RepID=A0ACB9SD36_9MYRT|nr:hypothetical protein MLD38_000761 [Melastoma candidum]
MEEAADSRRRQLHFHKGTPVSFPSSGVSAASPQTLDHNHSNSIHQLPGLQRPENLIIRPYQPEIEKDSNPDPLSFAFSPASSTPTPLLSGAVKYRECLRNHAASVGGNVTDGCCEFMPSGDAGTLEALKCAACECHRNFHRKEFEDGHGSRTHTPRLLLPPPHARFTVVSPRPVNVAYGGGGTDQSSSEDVDGATPVATKPEYVGLSAATVPGFMTKKRNRTKFTKEQKERMWEFAEKLGWRIQRPYDEEVDSFCELIGVRRQVFKVWMHNNKNNNSTNNSNKMVGYELAARIQQMPGTDPEPVHVAGRNAGEAASPRAGPDRA